MTWHNIGHTFRNFNGAFGIADSFSEYLIRLCVLLHMQGIQSRIWYMMDELQNHADKQQKTVSELQSNADRIQGRNNELQDSIVSGRTGGCKIHGFQI